MSTLNLVTEVSYPVQRKSGGAWVTVPEVFAAADPVLAPDFGRPDLDAAFTEFLIGLLATVAPPEDGDDWADRLREGWTPDAVRDALAPWAHAFELLGERPFAQDAGLDTRAPQAIDRVLPDAPGAQTLKLNADHFVKRGRYTAFAPGVAAMALFAHQIYASGGGRGYMTSPRGGGPLTTIALGRTLAETAWLNVPDEGILAAEHGAFSEPRGEAVFPWLGPDRTRAATGRKLQPDEMHALHIFWPMPRRVKLVAGDGPGTCELTGEPCETPITGMVQHWYGIDYAEGWCHPLSPYTTYPDRPATAVHVNPPGLDYGHWLGLVESWRDQKGNAPSGKQSRRVPAAVIASLRGRRWLHLRDAAPELARGTLRLRAFGYDMDNDKARRFAAAEMPLLAVGDLPDAAVNAVERDAARLVHAAFQVVQALASSYAEAAFKRRDRLNGKGERDRFAALRQEGRALNRTRMTARTERRFHEHVERLVTAAREADGDPSALEDGLMAVRQGWFDVLQRHGWDCLRRTIEAEAFTARTAERLVHARQAFARALYGKPLTQNVLALPARHAAPEEAA